MGLRHEMDVRRLFVPLSSVCESRFVRFQFGRRIHLELQIAACNPIWPADRAASARARGESYLVLREPKSKWSSQDEICFFIGLLAGFV